MITQACARWALSLGAKVLLPMPLMSPRSRQAYTAFLAQEAMELSSLKASELPL